jgi:hypothetical protein
VSSVFVHVRLALRRLRRAPGFALASTLTLALGVGATTAVFSVVNGVLLRPLPYQRADRLVDLSHTITVSGVSSVDQSDATYLYYRRANRVFAEVAAYRVVSVNLGPGISGGGTWRGIFAFKTGGQRPDGAPADNGDYRIEVYVFTYGGGKPYWGVIGDNNAGGNAPRRNGFSVENRSVPVPAGEWFKFEILWRRSAGDDGLVWVAIDGQTIARHEGPNLGAREMPVNRIMAPLLYSGSSMPIYQWVDDLEIWNGFPPAGSNTPYAPH